MRRSIGALALLIACSDPEPNRDADSDADSDAGNDAEPGDGANADATADAGSMCPPAEAPPSPTDGLLVYAGSLGGAGSADGVGTQARFSAVRAIVAHPNGKLYLSDELNRAVRELSPTGGECDPWTVRTLAGSATTIAARSDGPPPFLDGPRGMALDDDGQLYVVDGGGLTPDVRKLDPLSGAMQTLTRLDQLVTGLAIVGTDAIVALPDVSALLRVPLGPGTHEAVLYAGSRNNPGDSDADTREAARFTQPGYLAYDGARTLYVTDFMVPRLRKIDTTSGRVSTAADAPAPLYGIAAGGGRVFVTTIAGQAVYELGDDGALHVFAGDPASVGHRDGPRLEARFSGAGPLAIGADALFVADHLMHVVRRISFETGEVTTIAGKPRAADAFSAPDDHLWAPEGMARGDGDEIYVADTQHHVVRLVRADGTFETLAGGMNLPGHVDGVGDEARLNAPYDVAYGDGFLYVAESGSNTIRAIDLGNRTVMTIAGRADLPAGYAEGITGVSRFAQPSSIVYVPGAPAAVYVADHANFVVRRIALDDYQTSVVSGVPGDPSVAFPLALAYAEPVSESCAPPRCFRSGSSFAAVPSLFVGDVRGIVYRLRLPGFQGDYVTGAENQRFQRNGALSDARFTTVTDIAIDANGALLVVDQGANCVRRVSIETNVVTTVIGAPQLGRVELGALPAAVSRPWAILAIDAEQLLLTSAGESAVLSSPMPP